MHFSKESTAETLGTFVMVLFGCGPAVLSTLFNSHQGLFQIAMIWGLGVTLAIYLTRYLSCAHLNPARDFGPRLVTWIMG